MTDVPPEQSGSEQPGSDPSDSERSGPFRSVTARAPAGAGRVLVPAGSGARADARAAALLSLLDDESDAVWEVLRHEFEPDTRANRAVVEAARRGSAARARGRARGILAFWNRREVLRRLTRHVVRPRIDLEHALFLLARLDTYELDARPYVRVLDRMGADVRERIASQPDDLARPLVLVEYLRERGFTGDTDDYHHPHNIQLHRAIERRRGLPLTLTAIHLFVARRAGIRAAALPMPGHVFLRLYGGRRSILVDPFHGGELRTRRDLMDYLSQHGLVPQPSWFRDTDDAHLFHRHLLNLVHSCRRRGREREAQELHGVARVLAQSRGSEDSLVRARRS